MKKRLSVLGNSLALVIDKPIRKLLGIGRNTILQVSTDGRRILIEPTGQLHVPLITATEVDARRVFDTLVRHYGLWQPQFDELCPRKMRILVYRGGLEAETYDDDDRITMKRLEVCLRKRQADVPWEESIREALDKVPIVVG
jgi:bifunctional DNA-binding transcriptional regulator/antitoxin component of YhaV-PrlF toxin-antitoxin module